MTTPDRTQMDERQLIALENATKDEEDIVAGALAHPEYIEALRATGLRPSDFIGNAAFGEIWRSVLRDGPITTQTIADDLKHRTIAPPAGYGWITFLCEAEMNGAGRSLAYLIQRVRATISRASDQAERNALNAAAAAATNGNTHAVYERLAVDVTSIRARVATTPSIATGFITGSRLLELPPLSSQPILAGGIFSTGIYGAIYGLDGCAKSMGLAHLVMDIAGGVPWFGIDTRGPMNVAYMYSDDDRDEVRRRLIAVAIRDGIDLPDTWDRVHILARPYPWGSTLDLIDERTRDDLIHYLVDRDIKVLVADHIAAYHRLPAYDYMPLVDALDEIAQKVGAGVLIAGHPPKAGARAGPDAPGSDDLAGDRRLMNFARFRVRFTGTDLGNVFRIRFEKTNRGGKPPDIFIEQGPPQEPDPSLFKSAMVARAKDAKARRIDQIPRVLAAQPGHQMGGDQLAVALGLKSDRSLRRYILPVGVVRENGIFRLTDENPDLPGGSE